MESRLYGFEDRRYVFDGQIGSSKDLFHGWHWSDAHVFRIDPGM